ncbi:MAG: hypothetical protein RIC95_05950 [Vicingaceae bacterium]
MSKCTENIRLENEVYDFIDFVNDVGEESITDYLVWQWRKLNKKFNYLSVDKHTRQFENKVSGADFELELWILTKSNNLSFVFQAKKIIPEYNAYCSKLNYKNGTQRQLDVLINYAKSIKKLPFYLFYSPSDNKTKTKCPQNNILNSALFITDAYSVNNLTVRFKGKRLSKNRILEETNPFHCLFCCPLFDDVFTDYFTEYFPTLAENHSFDNTAIPNYVNAIANNELQDVAGLIEQNNLTVYRNIGVLDLRKEERPAQSTVNIK